MALGRLRGYLATAAKKNAKGKNKNKDKNKNGGKSKAVAELGVAHFVEKLLQILRVSPSTHAEAIKVAHALERSGIVALVTVPSVAMPLATVPSRLHTH